MSGKQAAIVIISIAIIVAAIVITVRRQSGGDTPPHVMARTQKYYCSTCDEMMELPLSEWVSLEYDKESGYKKCPVCGEFALTQALRCPHCKEWIADQLPREKLAGKPYYCPKCGERIIFDVGAPPEALEGEEPEPDD